MNSCCSFSYSSSLSLVIFLYCNWLNRSWLHQAVNKEAMCWAPAHLLTNLLLFPIWSWGRDGCRSDCCDDESRWNQPSEWPQRDPATLLNIASMCDIILLDVSLPITAPKWGHRSATKGSYSAPWWSKSNRARRGLMVAVAAVFWRDVRVRTQ